MPVLLARRDMPTRRTEAVTGCPAVLLADPDAQTLHVTTPGARVSLRSGRARVHKADADLGTVPIERLFALVLHGNIDVSSGLLRELLWRRVPVVWCSSNGRVIGRASSASAPNGSPRVQQHLASSRRHLDRGLVT
ncbi:CRISPR-associated endonuclease Cas1 [Tamaricihabitans halophyticus]|uniref:CRISPR-associated endonuclease Cas1 n=1 Tax=Tamaricihabitans halophyticus TaxID=1262583 RepID=UPI001A9E2420